MAKEVADIEAAIAEAIARGDAAAAAVIALEGYGREVLGYLRVTLRDPAAADEVFSVFAEQLWRGIGAFRGECTCRAWAYKLAWHAALRAHRDPYRRRARPLEDVDLSAQVEAIRSSTPDHLGTTMKDRVGRLRQALRPEEQTLLTLRIDRGLSWAEVAEVMSEPSKRVDPAALRKRFERLKEKVKRLALADAAGGDRAGRRSR